MKKFYVEIVKYGSPDELVRRMGPHNKNMAERVESGAERNLNLEDYFVRVVPE